MTTSELLQQLERQALTRWGQGLTAGYSDLYSDSVSYFDPLVEKRIDGLQAMLDYYAPWEGKIQVARFEILNTEVVASGELAMLTYNLVNYVKDDKGNETKGSCWNCTEVYRNEKSEWKIIHSHWSFTAHDAFRNMTPEQSEAG